MGSQVASSRIALAAACLAGFWALLSNEWLLAYLFSPDADLSDPTRWRVRLFQGVLLIAAFALAIFRAPLGRWFAAAVRQRPNRWALVLGGVGMAILIAVVELGYHARTTIRERQAPKVVVTYSEPLWKPGVVCHSRKFVGDRVIYDVTYTMDAFGRRVTPASEGRAPGRELLFFGGSFTFGQGVNDEETFPNVVARHLPEWRVTNFGYPGLGPTRMLDLLDDGDVLTPYRDSETVLVFTFIPNHVRRVVGSMRVSTSWGRELSYYAIDSTGALRRRGSLFSGRPVLSVIYPWLSREPILRYYEVDFPVTIRDRHLEHTAAVIAAGRDRFRADVPIGRFYVMLYPDRPQDELSGRRIVPYLASRGITVFDYSNRTDASEEDWLQWDTHPTAPAQARVGGWLAADLGAATATMVMTRTPDSP